MAASELQAEERREREYWSTSDLERPGAFSVRTIAHKMAEAGVLLDKLTEYAPDFERARSVLEIGAGQGWASCILKGLYPDKYVLSSDISKHALRSLGHWEETLRTRVDARIACRSYDIPLAEGSIDLVFCFQAAHHFRAHRDTLAEIHRLLASGGCCLYLYEPSCRSFVHGVARRRVLAKRPEVPEDLLVYPDMLRFGKEVGFSRSALHFSPTLANRGPMETVYYFVLDRISFLQRVLPCTADYCFRKAG